MSRSANENLYTLDVRNKAGRALVFIAGEETETIVEDASGERVRFRLSLDVLEVLHEALHDAQRLGYFEPDK